MSDTPDAAEYAADAGAQNGTGRDTAADAGA